MAARRQNRDCTPVPQAPTPTSYLAGDANARHPSGVYVPEPVVFSSPVSFEDPVYSRLTRRYSNWSDATSAGPLALGVGAVFGGVDKCPEIEITDFSYASASAYMPSTASSVTCASTISRASSIGSVCSPVLTESTSESWHSHRPPRGPSPLRNVYQRPGGEVAPKTDGVAAQEELGHPHICLWGRNGACEMDDFATREELNWHVKIEHLLECPVPGCTETTFESRDRLDCHMKWDHSNSRTSNASACRTANLLVANLAPSHNAQNDSPRAKAAANKMDATEDKVLKMEMSIGISKRKCREQLRTVLERKSRRLNGKSRTRSLLVSRDRLTTKQGHRKAPIVRACLEVARRSCWNPPVFRSSGSTVSSHF